MLQLSAKIRKETKKKVKNLREKGIIPGILYGHKTKNTSLEVSLKEFDKIFSQAGESSLISLEIDSKKFPVLIHQIQKHPVSGDIIHIDFFQPSLEEEIVAKVPLVYEGTPPAIKDLGGTFIKNLSEIDVKALPQNLPHEIKIDISSLKTFEDNILIKDLKLPPGVKVLKENDVILAFVAPLEKVEEELVKPVEEKVDEGEKVEKPKKVKEEELPPQPQKAPLAGGEKEKK